MGKKTHYCAECGNAIGDEPHCSVPLSKYAKGVFSDQYFHTRCFDRSDKQIRVEENFVEYLQRSSGAKVN